jgi:hypothetical protein
VNTTDYVYTNSSKSEIPDRTPEDLRYPSDSSAGKSGKQQFQEKSEHYRQLASEKLEQSRIPAARAIDRAAAALESRTRQWPTAHKAAEKLHDMAGYVRGHDVETMKNDASRAMKVNPGRSLLIAAAAGFILGRAFRR